MKKLFIGFLMMLAGSAWAEWQLVSSTNDGEIYLHYESIRIDGTMRKSWSIQNLSHRDESGELSRRINMEHDCENERFRMISISTYSEPMAQGDEMFNEYLSDSEWHDIAQATSMATILEIVCSKLPTP
jgi:hypothetical protein